MYASLDRIDVVSQRTDGRREYWQTDHRIAEQIEREPALSVLFALTRILNPRRGNEAGAPEPVIIYSATHPPPRFLLQAIRAAGGLLAIGDDLEPRAIPGPAASAGADGSFLGRAMRAAGGLFGAARPPSAAAPAGGAQSLDDIIQDAFATLARTVAARHGVGLDLDGLGRVEDALAERAGSAEEDETAYWTAVFELGGFGGELIRASNGGRWVQVETGSLPFALSTTYRGGQATVNPLGKAIKRFAEGEGDSVAALADVIRGNP
jgi:hypothetical protein